MAPDALTSRRTGTSRARLSIVSAIERQGLLILLVLLILFFALDPTSSGTFTTRASADNILSNQSVTGIIALAMIIPLTCGYFDLSVAAITGVTNVAMAAIIGPHGQPIWLGIAAALAIGLAVGCINAYLVAVLRLDGFIVTLGTYILLGGLLEWYTTAPIVNGIPQSLGAWGSTNWLGLPIPMWWLLVLAVAVWYMLMHTKFGVELEAIGSNERAAKLVGIRVQRSIFLTFVLSSLMAGVAGVLLTIRNGNGDPAAGPSFLFGALAAVFLGATTIRPGRYNVWGAMIGVFVVAVAVNGFTLLGAATWLTPVFNGLALVGAVTVSTLMGRRRLAAKTGAAARSAVPDHAGAVDEAQSISLGAEEARNGKAAPDPNKRH